MPVAGGGTSVSVDGPGVAGRVAGDAEGCAVWVLPAGDAVLGGSAEGLGERVIGAVPGGEVGAGEGTDAVGVPAPGVAVGPGGGVGTRVGLGSVGPGVTGLVGVHEGVGEGIVGV
jgi:hypothetical protein